MGKILEIIKEINKMNKTKIEKLVNHYVFLQKKRDSDIENDNILFAKINMELMLEIREMVRQHGKMKEFRAELMAMNKSNDIKAREIN